MTNLRGDCPPEAKPHLNRLGWTITAQVGHSAMTPSGQGIICIMFTKTSERQSETAVNGLKNSTDRFSNFKNTRKQYVSFLNTLHC